MGARWPPRAGPRPGRRAPGWARSPWTARSHALPRPGVPRPSATTTAKPWSANHWEREEQVARPQDALAVRAAVRVERGRAAGRRARCPRGQQHRGGQPPGAGPQQRDVRVDRWRHGQRCGSSGPPRTAVADAAGRRAWPSAAPPWSRRPPPCARRARSSAARAGRAPPSSCQRHTCCSVGLVEVVGGEDARLLAPTSRTARTCRSGGVTTSLPTSSRRAPSRSAHAHEATVAEQRRRARHQLDPARRRSSSNQVSVLPVVRVGREDGEAALVARLHGEQQRPAGRPRHVGQVGEPLAVPHAPRPRPPSEPHDVERHERVVGAGGRVGELGRRLRRAGPGRRSTSAAPARCRPGPRRATRRRAPTSSPRVRPISSAAMNSAEPHDTSGSSGRRRRWRPAGRQRPSSSATRKRRPRDVGHAAWPSDRAAGRTPGPRPAARGPRRQQPGHEQPPTEGEGGGHHAGVGGVGHHAARASRGPARAGPAPRPAGRLSSPPASSSRGSATRRSSPVATSSTQRQLTGSSPARERANTTRRPSGDTVRLRGSPSVKRCVRAERRG